MLNERAQIRQLNLLVSRKILRRKLSVRDQYFPLDFHLARQL